MATNSACPDDDSNAAIACLLRQINGNTAPNLNIWDPLNFGFTAAIGVLALVVACVTVFQGLLAAGPGRLKAGASAIGPFSIHSRSRFDRVEFGLRTTARVPLITWSVVYHRIVRQKYQPNSITAQRRWRHGSNAEIGVNESGPQSRRPNDSTASWLNLLAALGLDDPEMFPLIERDTDYLPADIQAAPAAAELRCLAILAVLADNGATIERQERFFKVDADSSQLSFRDHPILGQLAAYEAYEETAFLKVGDSIPLEFGSKFPMLTIPELDRGLQLASGRLAYADIRLVPSIDSEPDRRGFMTLVQDLSNRSRGCTHDICRHAVEDWRQIADDLQYHRNWKLMHTVKSLNMAIALLAAERANLCRAFPRQKLRLDDALKDILQLSSFWKEDVSFKDFVQLREIMCSSFWSKQNMPYKEWCSASWVVDFTEIQSMVPNPFSASGQKAQCFRWKSVMKSLGNVRIYLQRKRDPSISEFESNSMSAATLSQLLAVLDHWLLHEGGKWVSCTVLKMMYQLGRSKEILHTDRAGLSTRSSVAMDQMTTVDLLIEDEAQLLKESAAGRYHIAVTEKDDFIKEHISTLVVLRGILMSMLLDMGADTSDLFRSDFRDSIVKML